MKKTEIFFFEELSGGKNLSALSDEKREGIFEVIYKTNKKIRNKKRIRK